MNKSVWEIPNDKDGRVQVTFKLLVIIVNDELIIVIGIFLLVVDFALLLHTHIRSLLLLISLTNPFIFLYT